MKLWRDLKGFGMTEVLIIVVVVGALGLAGAKVYTSRDKQPTAQTETGQSTEETEVGADNEAQDPTDDLLPYTLPTGWTQKECKPAQIAIVPPKTADPNCEADQPNTTILMYVDENNEYIDPESCATTKTKRNMDYAGHESYVCEDVTVDGHKGIRETITDTQRGIYGKAAFTSYTFPSSGKLLIMSYTDIESLGYPDYLADFDKFVRSFKFQ